MPAKNTVYIAKSGAVTVPVRSVTATTTNKRTGKKYKYQAYRIKYRLHGCTRPIQLTRSELEGPKGAKAAAKHAAEKIASGQTQQLHLSNHEVESYRRLQKICEGMGKTPEIVCTEYRDAFLKILAGGTIMEAILYYNKHRSQTDIAPKPVPAIVKELLERKEADGLSEMHRADLKKRLNRFAAAFPIDIDKISGTEINQWLLAIKTRPKKDKEKPRPISPRTRNNFRGAISTLVTYARQNKYLPRDWKELELVNTAKTTIDKIEIFSPDELSKILSACNEHQLPFIAIAAFSGVRHEEIKRLTWENIRWDSRYIEIGAKIAKTSSRRLVPIKDNLLQWLMPYRNKTGPICTRMKMNKQIARLSKKALIKWKRNALRHSYVSYRVAECSNVAEVALECGNSPQKIFTNYRELVTKTEAEKWFGILPGFGKVVQLPAKQQQTPVAKRFQKQN